MYHIVQENCFNEENYNNLILALDRLNIDYEIIKLYPFLEEIKFKTNRKDVFIWGATKLSRLAKNYNWNPGSLLNKNHDFNVYKKYYKNHLFNINSKIIKFGDDYNFPDGFFARPTSDGKAFTGQVFNKEDFLKFRERNLVDINTEIQISGIKKIYKEIRFWIVKGKIITASQYRLGNRTLLDNNVEKEAYKFCKKMISIFQLANAFVMDLCLGEDGWKIMECGCINSAGFYKANMQKLVYEIENEFNKDN